MRGEGREDRPGIVIKHIKSFRAALFQKGGIIGFGFMRVGEYSFVEFCEVVRAFHGSPAPGVLIGGYMVELARRSLPAGVLFEAICETRVCLPDAVQLLTPCTFGNGRVRVIHVGRFALTLYDKATGAGARAFVDAGRLSAWPELRAWFMKEVPKARQDGGLLLSEICSAGDGLLGVQPVMVDLKRLGLKKIGPVALCPSCGEAYPASDGGTCGGCAGKLPYIQEVGAGTVR